jgi:hypothetical protein
MRPVQIKALVGQVDAAPNVRQTSVCCGLIGKPLGRNQRTSLSNHDKRKFVGHLATSDLFTGFSLLDKETFGTGK